MPNRQPENVEELQSWIRQWNGLLKQYNDDTGWGAHWVQLGRTATELVGAMDDYPEYDDSEIRQATQQMADCADMMTEVRSNFLAVVKKMKDAQ